MRGLSLNEGQIWREGELFVFKEVIGWRESEEQNWPIKWDSAPFQARITHSKNVVVVEMQFA